MPRGKRESARGFSPGKLYEMFWRAGRVEEKEEKKEDYESFIRFCEEAHKKVRYSGNVDPEVRRALEFLGWSLEPEAVYSAAKLAAMYALVVGIVLVPFIFQGMGWIDVLSLDVRAIAQDFVFTLQDNPFSILVLLLPFIMYYIAYYSVLSYPKSLAQKIFDADLLPSLRVIGNMVLSMKLVPNLEKAASFAVEHGKGFLAEQLKQALWDLQLGIYATMEDAIDKIAYRVGRYSDEFKHALMRIRTSLLEADDAKRFLLLDGALKEVVDGVKNRMVAQASSLYMPSVQLFYLGIFLPLLLFIILPIWAIFSENSPAANPFFIFGLYNIVLPLATFYFAKTILSKRPEAYTPPEVPDKLIKNARAKTRSYAVQAALILIIGVAASYFLHTLVDNTPEKVLDAAHVCGNFESLRDCVKYYKTEEPERYAYYLQGEDTTPYALIFGSLLSVAFSIAFFLYAYTRERIKVQEEIMEMEKEFKDAVYVLASRMGEGKPLESALDAVRENMPEARISNLFQRISYNVKNLGLTLEEAVFSPVFGALKDVPSKILHDAMRLVVSAVSLGTELAARALASLSEQLRNEEQVVQRIREKTGEIATMMIAMAYLVAPVVLGITVALEKVIVASAAGTDFGGAEFEGLDTTQLGDVGTAIESSFKLVASAKGQQIPDWLFILSVAIYTIEISVLLTYFASYLHDGPNRLRMLRRIAYSLVVSSVLFSVTAYASMMLVRGML